MILIAAVAALSLGQSLSEGASVVFCGFPTAEPSSTVRLVTHSASAVLDKETYTQESLTQFRNDSDKPVTVNLVVPVNGQNVTWPMVKDYRVSATLDKVALTLARTSSTNEPDEVAKRNMVVYGMYKGMHKATVTFGPKQTRSLAISFKAPLGKAGLDGLQRVIAYETRGASTWSGPVQQFNYSIKYTPQLVFQVFAALPRWAEWQISSRGAFVKKTEFVPESKTLVIFTYYPGGFGRIGG